MIWKYVWCGILSAILFATECFGDAPDPSNHPGTVSAALLAGHSSNLPDSRTLMLLGVGLLAMGMLKRRPSTRKRYRDHFIV